MENTALKLKKKKRTAGAWIDALVDGTGKFCNLETNEGLTRSGKLTSIRTKVILFNGEKVDVVYELELNGDPSDTLLVSSLAKINIG
jgi:hypothetical protein